MIVWQSTHDKVKEKYEKIRTKYDELVQTYNKAVRTVNALRKDRDEWRDIAHNIRDDFLRVKQQRDDARQKATESGFTQEDLRAMRRMLHPDRNNGSPTATKLTQKINGMIK